MIYFHAKQYDQAIEQCKKALELEPDTLTIFDTAIIKVRLLYSFLST
ncbi:tetratricopeptide repeat protein [Acidobacteriota bacterium]